MTPTDIRSIGSRRLGAMLLSVALIGSLFVPSVTLAVGPSVTINQAVDQPDPTGTSPINFTVVFTDPVEGFTGDDVEIISVAGGTLTVVVTGGSKVYDVAVSGMTTSGGVTAFVPAGAAFNPEGQPNLASTSTDNTVGWVPGGPSVTINQAAGQADPTSISPINFTVVFGAVVTGFAGSDVTVAGSAGGTKVAAVTGGGTTYNVAVTGMTTSGTVIATVTEGISFNQVFQPSLASTSTDHTVTWSPGPSVTISPAVGQATLTGTSPINFTVVFTDPVVGFTSEDVSFSSSISGGTPIGGTPIASVSGSGTTYNVAVTGMTTSDYVFAHVITGAAFSAEGKPSLASVSNGPVYWSPGGPSVTVNQAAGQADPTGTSPITFIVLFSAPVTEFSSGDVTISGTAGGTKTATVTGSGTTYNVAVSGMTTSGTVIAAVPESVARDASIRPNLASTTTDNTVTWAPAGASTITLTTSAPVPPGAKDPVILWGQGFTLGVQFGTNGANRSFQLQGTRDELTWTTITTLTTDANGRASFFYRPVTNLFYRAVFVGTPELAAATSNQVRTVVRELAVMRPTNNGSTRSISRNSSITFTTTVRPARPELAPATVSFFFYRQVSGVWQLATRRDVVTDSAGLARTTFTFASSGQWYVRSQANPTPYNANSVLTPVERYSVG